MNNKIKIITIILLLNFVLTENCWPQHQEFKKLADTPPMGWNSWNWFGKNGINEQLVREIIDAMASNGLRDAGYQYVVIDGGWRDTKLGPKGELLCHPIKFPNGIKPLADYAHSKGMKIGLHTVPGTHDCGGDLVGGYGHEDVHVNQFADWGIDFIKLDRCQYRNDGGWTEELIRELYTKWSKLIQATGRDIILNISAYKFREWNPEMSHMSRTTLDIAAKNTGGANFTDEKPVKNFLSVMTIADQNNETAAYARPGYWNDPDMMVTGEQGLTFEEQKAHFALWCIMSSPLFLGNDPRNMTREEKSIILNKTAIEINQDPSEQGSRIHQQGDKEIWAKKLSNGKTAVLLLNRNPVKSTSISLELSDIGITTKASINDVYKCKDLGIFSGVFTQHIFPHSALFILVEPENRLSQKEVFTKGFPVTLSFRNDKYGINEEFEFWEKAYLDVNSITKKYLTEEVDMDPVVAKYANIFSEKHPEKLMLLHLNGEGISIKHKQVHEKFFPGHWVYEAGTDLSADISENQTDIKVKSTEMFSEEAYSIHAQAKITGKLPHDIIIVEKDSNGNNLWYTSEFATIEKIDHDNNTITVKRGQYYSTSRSFDKNNTYIAPLSGASWGGNLMWYYNLSSVCPTDSNGNSCADIFLKDIKSWFSPEGILENLDGIGFDVNYFTSTHANWDVNNDGIADKGFVNGKNIWREGDWAFLQQLREIMGDDFLITADGWRDEMQRGVGILNGMETEGLCRPNDGYRQISRTINQHTYWNLYNDTRYKFSYITSKLSNPEDAKLSEQLYRMGIGIATCLEVAYTTLPGQLAEAAGGDLNKPNWLGNVVSEIKYPAKKTPDLLKGAGLQMNTDLINEFDLSNVDYRVEDKTLYIKGKDSKYNDLIISGPEVDLNKGDLIIFFEAKAIEGFYDFDKNDKVPRKINIKINGLPVNTLTEDSGMFLNMHNDLAGFMGTAGYTPLSFYFRNVGKSSGKIKLSIEVEEQGEFAIRNLTIHNASSVIAREFENGVVLVNPSFDEYKFNLSDIFFEEKSFRRINDNTSYNNGKAITNNNVIVPALNALFLIKDTSPN